MSDTEHMGDRLCRARKRRKLTQRALAEKASVSDGYVSMIETGRHVENFSVANINKLASALEVPLEWLVNGGPEPIWDPADTLPDATARIQAALANPEDTHPCKPKFEVIEDSDPAA